MMKSFWEYLFPGLFGLIIYATIRLVNDLVDDNSRFWERPWAVTLIELSVTIILGYLMLYLIRKLESRYLNRSLKKLSFGQITREFFVVLGFSLIIINILVLPLLIFTDDGLSDSDFVQINIIPSLYLLIYFSIRRGNYYIKELLQSKLKLEQIENDRLNTELTFLKGQFSPHFLFNGLNNIYFQMDKNVPEAKKSVEQLAELLRYHLYQAQDEFVPIARESEFITLYTNVHRLRRQEDLEVVTSLSRSGKQIYPHLFMPLVENAFKYVGGVKSCIRITLQEIDRSAHFEITNSVRKVHHFNQPRGIGLTNLKRRLELLYPGQYVLEIDPQDDMYTAKLSIPTL